MRIPSSRPCRAWGKWRSREIISSPALESIPQKSYRSSAFWIDQAADVSAGTYRTTDSQGPKQIFIVRPADLRAPTFTEWTLSFPSGWGAPQSIPWHRFQSWTECADPGIRYFSGTATYLTTFQISAESLATGRQLWLELHQVREIATVTVNGRKVDTVWRQPFTARVDQFLHAGDNKIEINVTNLWPNRLIGDLQPSATEKFTHTNVRSYTKDSQLPPSGLLETATEDERRQYSLTQKMYAGYPHEWILPRWRSYLLGDVKAVIAVRPLQNFTLQNRLLS